MLMKYGNINAINMSYKNTHILLVLALVFSSSAGVTSMYAGDMENMTGCPFSGTASICQMGVFEHIGAFQNMFLSVPAESVLLSVLLVFLFVSFPAIPHINGPPNSFRFFIRESFSFSNLNRILLALSDGRLQPKLYA